MTEHPSHSPEAKTLSRRNFLKLALVGVGATAAATAPPIWKRVLFPFFKSRRPKTETIKPEAARVTKSKDNLLPVDFEGPYLPRIISYCDESNPLTDDQGNYFDTRSCAFVEQEQVGNFALRKDKLRSTIEFQDYHITPDDFLSDSITSLVDEFEFYYQSLQVPGLSSEAEVMQKLSSLARAVGMSLGYNRKASHQAQRIESSIEERLDSDATSCLDTSITALIVAARALGMRCDVMYFGAYSEDEDEPRFHACLVFDLAGTAVVLDPTFDSGLYTFQEYFELNYRRREKQLFDRVYCDSPFHPGPLMPSLAENTNWLSGSLSELQVELSVTILKQQMEKRTSSKTYQ